ncbi:peptide-methionine (S)-S-oxide reductase MsrA [Nitrosomonas sp. Nm166]|uniref:peptide-methionine (S)-S-oxide reductase MsrA n=1 Tax=Nitrosomonas sp. Nm166 TaxID=1881054 RepID=UPI0008EE6A22|nr:peptide-methionine (S)-S-oxide reductase MsrA [Nitrosomonas sp. Nm166]SFD88933.1 peptide-methionine (S)-S-oxide reductase [Nitrosomonas sp. Nm166]
MQTLTSNRHLMLVWLPILILSACQQVSAPTVESTAAQIPNKNLETATFAGGCFWCTESDFDKIPGVVSTTSGYIGGTVANPTYHQVSTGKTGHVEAVRIHFDNTKTDFSKLLTTYWLTIDPLTANQQFCDIGSQYRSVIFYHNSDQRNLAEISKKTLEASGRFTQPIMTEILPATEFYRAEEYHQDYYLKNPLRYAYYRKNCGRDKRLEELWGIQH